MTAKSFPIIKDFFKDHLSANNSKKQASVMSDFFKKVLDISNEAYSEYRKLKHETNAIKLCASDYVLKQLDELEKSTKESLDEAEIMMNRMSVLVRSNDQKFNEEYQSYIKSLSEKVLIHKKYLIEYMRIDLNNI